MRTYTGLMDLGGQSRRWTCIIKNYELPGFAENAADEAKDNVLAWLGGTDTELDQFGTEKGVDA